MYKYLDDFDIYFSLQSMKYTRIETSWGHGALLYSLKNSVLNNSNRGIQSFYFMVKFKILIMGLMTNKHRITHPPTGIQLKYSL